MIVEVSTKKLMLSLINIEEYTMDRMLINGIKNILPNLNLQESTIHGRGYL